MSFPIKMVSVGKALTNGLWSLVVLLFCSQLNAQFVSNGATLSVTNKTILSVTDFEGSGVFDLEGFIYLRGDIDYASEITGSSDFFLIGNDQNVKLASGETLNALHIQGGGEKILLSDLSINGQLSFAEGLVNVSGNELKLSDEATIDGASENSFVIGGMSREGDSSLFFPIGSSSRYAPVQLDGLTTPSSEFNISFSDLDPAGNAGTGLLGVSSNGFWELELLSGSLGGGEITLPINNENVIDNTEQAVVAFGSAAGETFRSLGGVDIIGSIEDGSVTSSSPLTSGLFTIGRFFDENLRVQDSLALVAIYEATAGKEWIDNSGWLSEGLDSWNGVGISDKRVSTVDLSENNLQNSFPSLTEGLSDLQALNISSNSLEEIGSLVLLSGLSTLDVSNNRLQFGSLENIPSSIDNRILGPQTNALNAISTLQDVGTTYVVDRTISGSNNQYQWFRNGDEISNTGGTLSLDISSFEDEGTFFADVTNTRVPGVTIRTSPVALKVSSIERDRLSLLVIYDSLNASSTWTNGADWPNNGDISTWVGVVVDPALNRVTELDLSGSNVIGDMPDDLQDIGGLTRLDLSNNEISRLPDISSLTLSQVNVSGNRLDFGDLEPNITILGGLENYDNQGLIGEEDREELVARGNDFTLTFTTGGTANTYSWTRLNALGSTGVDEESNSVSIDNIRYENMGIFTVQVSNTIVPGLTLESHPINVFATARLDGDIVDENGDPLPEGSVQALRIPFTGEDSRGYDSLDAIAVVNGSFKFGELVLGDLLLSTRVEDGTETYLPTYFGNTPFFTDASTIELREDFSITGYQMQLNPPGFEPGDGDGEVGLGVESDFAEDRQQAREAGRLTARRKLQKVGCSLRRRRRATGGRDEGIANDDEFELVVYKETDEDGRVTFENLPPDTYRLNIEYPGIPMDPDSFIEFEVGEGGLENNTLQLEATVDENGIAVELVEELGFYRHYFKDLELYPNPVDRELTIRYSKLLSEHVRVQLLNLQGRLIKEERVGRGYNQEMVLDTQDVEEGIYLVRFIDPTRREGNNIVTYKIIVKRR